MEWRSLKSFLPFFAVMYTHEKGCDEPHEWKLGCTELEKVGNYDLTQENPWVFRFLDQLATPREWKDIPLPNYQSVAAAAIAAAKASTSSQKKPDPEPEKDEKEDKLQEGVKELLAVHHSYFDVLLSMGVDPIKDYEERQAENILARVKPRDTKCKVCSKSYHSTQKLKNHIRKGHIRKTPYFCGECNQYYGDSQLLKVHMRKHTPEGEEVSAHKCNTSGETYPTIGKLNQHSQKHEDIKCSMYGKGFSYVRTKKTHEEESCPNRPGAGPAPAKRGKKSGEPQKESGEPSELHWYCHLCDLDYGACRNLKKHLNTHHSGVEVAANAWR